MDFICVYIFCDISNTSENLCNQIRVKFLYDFKMLKNSCFPIFMHSMQISIILFTVMQYLNSQAALMTLLRIPFQFSSVHQRKSVTGWYYSYNWEFIMEASESNCKQILKDAFGKYFSS